MQYGAGSAALLTGDANLIARYLGSASSATQFVDHFRAEGQRYDYQWEERWIRDEGYLKIVPETVARLLEATGVGPGAIDFFCLSSTISGRRGGRGQASEAAARGAGRRVCRALRRHRRRAPAADARRGA